MSNNTPVRRGMLAKLEATFQPLKIDLLNESHMHNVPPNSETHFKLLMISNKFNGLGKVKRHQAVYQALNEELKGGVHALSLYLYTEEEWQQKPASSLPESPPCLGGGEK